MLDLVIFFFVLFLKPDDVEETLVFDIFPDNPHHVS